MIDRDEARARLIALAETTPKGEQRDAYVLGARALSEDLLEKHDADIRRQTIDEFIDRFNKSTIILGRATGRTFMLKCLNDIAKQMKGEAE